MALSQFTQAKFDAAGGTISVSGPFQLRLPEEKGMRVTCIHFLLIQDGEVVEGTGETAVAGSSDAAAAGDWSGTTSTPAAHFKAGMAQGVGFAVLARSGADAGYQTYTWSHAVKVGAA
jgi:hypothetical protein